MSDGALYAGTVTHRRVRPRDHRLSYSIYSLLLDIDRIEALSKRLTFFSRNRFNLFGFYDRDYGDGSGTPLRDQVERLLRAAGLEPDGGPIRLLTMPRVLGYAFNPLSIYFCYRRSGELAALLYEVNNTFGQRHSYLIPATAGGDGVLRQTAEKCFYVSPFMDMDLIYAFRVRPPEESLSVGILASDSQGPVLSAVHIATRRPLTDRHLLGAFLAYPLLTLKVVVGIHWEALFIWAKGIGLRRRPPPPSEPVSVQPVGLQQASIATASLSKDPSAHVFR